MAAKGGMAVGYVRMTGPDDELDVYSNSFRPTNALPLKCKHCTFPDLDFAPNPYLIARGFASAAETWSALCGNFLVRERVRRLLELAVPKACSFYPTAELKSKKATPWFLAVPKQVIPTPGLNLWQPGKCSKCGEPKLGFDPYKERGGQRVYAVLDKCDPKGADVFKSQEWSGRQVAEDQFEEINRYRKQSGHKLMEWSEWYDHVDPPAHKQRWTRLMLERELFFSVRLAQLWKAAKVKGKLVVYWDFKDFKPTPEDKAWVEEKMDLLAEQGLVEASAKGAKKPSGKGAARKVAAPAAEKKQAVDAEKWFKGYLKSNAKKKPADVDFEAVEKKHKVKLPKSYKDFIMKIGGKSFKDVNDMEGSTTKVLPPRQLDFNDYRAGALEDTDEESAAVDGVMFATVDSGDCFVFDLSGKNKDYPVFFYNHELNMMEPWANNFAGCVKRFAEKH